MEIIKRNRARRQFGCPLAEREGYINDALRVLDCGSEMPPHAPFEPQNPPIIQQSIPKPIRPSKGFRRIPATISGECFVPIVRNCPDDRIRQGDCEQSVIRGLRRSRLAHGYSLSPLPRLKSVSQRRSFLNYGPVHNTFAQHLLLVSSDQPRPPEDHPSNRSSFTASLHPVPQNSHRRRCRECQRPGLASALGLNGLLQAGYESEFPV